MSHISQFCGGIWNKLVKKWENVTFNIFSTPYMGRLDDFKDWLGRLSLSRQHFLLPITTVLWTKQSLSLPKLVMRNPFFELDTINSTTTLINPLACKASCLPATCVACTLDLHECSLTLYKYNIVLVHRICTMMYSVLCTTTILYTTDYKLLYSVQVCAKLYNPYWNIDTDGKQISSNPSFQDKYFSQKHTIFDIPPPHTYINALQCLPKKALHKKVIFG